MWGINPSCPTGVAGEGSFSLHDHLPKHSLLWRPRALTKPGWGSSHQCFSFPDPKWHFHFLTLVVPSEWNTESTNLCRRAPSLLPRCAAGFPSITLCRYWFWAPICSFIAVWPGCKFKRAIYDPIPYSDSLDYEYENELKRLKHIHRKDTLFLNP